MAEGKTPYQILEDYVEKIYESLHDSLVRNNRFASGDLSQSIYVAPPKIFGQKITLQVFMDGYWKFVDRGVNGIQRKVGSEYSFKKKNIDRQAMIKHIANRGIDTKDIKNFYTNSKGLKVARKKPLDAQKAVNTLAFLIGRKISKFGIQPTNFVEEGIEGLDKMLEKDLLEAVGRQIEIEITVK